LDYGITAPSDFLQLAL